MRNTIETVKYEDGTYRVTYCYAMEDGDGRAEATKIATVASQRLDFLDSGATYQCCEGVDINSKLVVSAGVTGSKRGVYSTSKGRIDLGWVMTCEDVALYATGYRPLLTKVMTCQEPLGSRMISFLFGTAEPKQGVA